jgi:hypothetical protein
MAMLDLVAWVVINECAISRIEDHPIADDVGSYPVERYPGDRAASKYLAENGSAVTHIRGEPAPFDAPTNITITVSYCRP